MYLISVCATKNILVTKTFFLQKGSFLPAEMSMYLTGSLTMTAAPSAYGLGRQPAFNLLHKH